MIAPILVKKQHKAKNQSFADPLKVTKKTVVAENWELTAPCSAKIVFELILKNRY